MTKLALLLLLAILPGCARAALPAPTAPARAFVAQQAALESQLASIQASVESEGAPAPAPEAPAPAAAGPEVDPSQLVQGVLKQLLSSLLAKKGKLQLLRRFEEDGTAKLEYLAPTGKRQVIEDVLTSEEDRKLMETVLTLILNS